MARQTIEIDDDVWALLKKNAEPFVDTPNSVLRRLLLHSQAPVAQPDPPQAQQAATVKKPAPDTQKVQDINALLSSEENEKKAAPQSAPVPEAKLEAVPQAPAAEKEADLESLEQKTENKFIMASKKPSKLHLRNGKVIEIDSYEIADNVLYGKVLGCTLDFEVSEIREITCEKK